MAQDDASTPPLAEPFVPSSPAGEASNAANATAGLGHQDSPGPHAPTGPSEPVSEKKGPLSVDHIEAAAVEKVLNSEIGINTLLMRLKQSVASARDFAVYLRKRSAIEDEHAQGLRKLCRSTLDNVHRQDHRQDSFSQSYEEINRINELIADQEIQFANALHQMSDDLQDLASNTERGRKQCKQNGLSGERKAQDAETAMTKAKTKYFGLAEDYERVKTGGDRSKKFGLKGKSATQHEEDLSRKVQIADADYASKVQNAQRQRSELVASIRPQVTKALQELIREIDAGLALQIQKFAAFTEKWMLSGALCISPLRPLDNGDASALRGIREVANTINNEKDFNRYVAGFASRVGFAPPEIQYEQHPSLAPRPSVSQPPQSWQSQTSTAPPQPSMYSTAMATHFPHDSHGGTIDSPYGSISANNEGPSDAVTDITLSDKPPPVYNAQPPMQSMVSPAYVGIMPRGEPGLASDALQNLPPLKPVFGVSLQELFDRDQFPVPVVVSQCLQAVDMYGLEVEGIYRLSGTASHIAQIKSLFDHDSSLIDFRNPESFYHDVNSVAGLLKQFLRELPDPLLPSEHYEEFINAAKIQDHTVRRDSLHAIINGLADANYATLRALVLHLNRVQEHSSINRMPAANLAIVFGPTLMGTGNDLKDSGWQVKVVETILQNTYQIFDDD